MISWEENIFSLSSCGQILPIQLLNKIISIFFVLYTVYSGIGGGGGGWGKLIDLNIFFKNRLKVDMKARIYNLHISYQNCLYFIRNRWNLIKIVYIFSKPSMSYKKKHLN